MEVNLHELHGNWDRGFALHKHVLRSTFTGYNEFDRKTFDTIRSEPGEALFQLKYRSDFTRVEPLAQAIFDHIVPAIGQFGIVIPMPPTKQRARQPVYEIAARVSALNGSLYAPAILKKNPPPPGAPEIKDLGTKAEKVAALAERFAVNKDFITNEGKWGALLIDDKYDTGASLEAACAVLRTYAKIGQIFVATCSW